MSSRSLTGRPAGFGRRAPRSQTTPRQAQRAQQAQHRDRRGPCQRRPRLEVPRSFRSLDPIDRRRRIGQEHVTKICQLHQLLLELVPGGAKKDLSAAQARKILAGVRPGDEVGKLRKRIALELVVDLERIYLRKKQANKELVTLLKTTGTGLLDLHGIGPTGAARLLVEVGNITRFPNRGHFASWTGTAPIRVPASIEPMSRSTPVAGNPSTRPASRRDATFPTRRDRSSPVQS